MTITKNEAYSFFSKLVDKTSDPLVLLDVLVNYFVCQPTDGEIILSKEQREKITFYIATNQKLEAVKHVKNFTGLSLLESKKTVELFQQQKDYAETKKVYSEDQKNMSQDQKDRFVFDALNKIKTDYKL